MAYVAPPGDKSGVHSLITCLYSGTNPPPPGVIGGNGDRKGQITSSTDLWLTIGWGALTPSQINNFFGAEYGSIVISHYDEPTKVVGSAVDTISWGDANAKKETDNSRWTAPAAVNDPTLNGGKPFTQTQLFAHVGPLPIGTYWVAPSLGLIKTVFDGSEAVSGTWFNAGCEMVVS